MATLCGAGDGGGFKYRLDYSAVSIVQCVAAKIICPFLQEDLAS